MGLDNGKFYNTEMSENNATHTFSSFLRGLCYFPRKKNSKKCHSHYSLTSRGCKIAAERYSFHYWAPASGSAGCWTPYYAQNVDQMYSDYNESWYVGWWARLAASRSALDIFDQMWLPPVV